MRSESPDLPKTSYMPRVTQEYHIPNYTGACDTLDVVYVQGKKEYHTQNYTGTRDTLDVVHTQGSTGERPRTTLVPVIHWMLYIHRVAQENHSELHWHL